VTSFTTKDYIEEHYGALLERFEFRLIDEQPPDKPSHLVFESGTCRLRITEIKVDTDIDIGGPYADLTPGSSSGWMSVYEMLDRVDPERGAEHPSNWTSRMSVGEMDQLTARRLDRVFPLIFEEIRRSPRTQAATRAVPSGAKFVRIVRALWKVYGPARNDR
jgi:hypothetical protein